MKGWFVFLRILLYPLARIVAPFRIMDKYKYKKYDRGQILIQNHLSWMDILYVYFCLPGFKRALSKKENAINKFSYAFMRSIGVIFVDRDKPELSSMRECISSLKDGVTLNICPEGTRNRVNRELQEMHSGAAMFALKGNARVVPFVVHHKGKLFRRNYIGIGDPVELSDLMDKRMDETVLREATERFRVGMQATLDKLDAWVEQKGYKTERKKNRKERKKIKIEMRKLKFQYKTAKREYAASNRSR